MKLDKPLFMGLDIWVTMTWTTCFSVILLTNDPLTWCVRLWGREVDECGCGDSEPVMELPD